MGDRTPKRSQNPSNNGFSPVILPESPAAASPQKNLTGLPRVVRDLAADLYNNIQRWNELHVQGAGLLKQIASYKADNPRSLSNNLEEPVNDLFKIVQSLRHYKDLLLNFATQIRVSEKMQKQPEPLFISLEVNRLANLVEEIAKAYEAEFDLKEKVLENVAYSKNKDDAMFWAALWTYQTQITKEINFKLEILLIETGHRKIS